MLRKLGELITKKPLAFIALWVIILVISVPLALSLDGRLHYDITSFIPKNLESYNSNQIYEKQFPNDSQSQLVVAVQSDNKTLAMHFIDDLNRTVGNDTRIINVSSTTSVYDIQRLALVNMAPELHSTLLDAFDNASDANHDLYNATETVRNSSRDLYYLKDNVTKVNSQLYEARKTILSTSQQLYSGRDQLVTAHDGLYQVKGAADVLFGLPLGYVDAYGKAMKGGMTDAQASDAALTAMKSYISGSVPAANQGLALGYISYFNGYWDAYASDADPMDRAQKVLSNNADSFITANVPAGQEQTLLLSARHSLSLSSYTNAANVKAFCIGAVMQSENLDSSYQSKLSAIYDLGASPSGVAYDNMVLGSVPSDQQSAAREVYNLGRNPSDGTIGTYLVNKALSSVNKTDTNATQVIQDAWNLGPSETNDDFDKYVVDKASKDMNATEKAQVQQIYGWGPNPNDSTIRDYVLQQAGSGHNASENQTIAEIYSLGQNATPDVIRNYVVTKAASELNVTGNLSFFGAIMDFGRNTPDSQLESFARTWAYSHDYSNPQIFTDSIVSNLASGNLTLYAVMLNDDEASQDAHNAVGYVRDDIATVKNSGSYAGVTTYVTGVSSFAVDTMSAATGDVDNIDKISVILILIILGVYFLSILTPFIPLAVIGCAIVSGFGLLYLSSYTVDLYYLTKTFMIVVMLGAGTDYCVFLLTRYAEERRIGVDVKESVVYAVQHAGLSILCSGCTAMIGFAALMFIDNGIFKSMGQSMALAIFVSMMISITLMPAVLTLFGDKVFWPRKIYNVGAKVTRTGTVMRKITHVVIKHAKLILILTVLFAVPAIWLYTQMSQGQDLISMMPSNIESKTGYDVINGQFGSGNIDKTRVVVTLPTDIKENGNYSAAALDRIEQLSAMVAGVSNVDKVYSMTRPEGSVIDYNNLSAYTAIEKQYYQTYMDNATGADDRTTTINVAFKGSPYSAESDKAISDMREKFQAYMNSNSGTSITVGGQAAMSYDYQEICTDRFPIVIVMVFVGIFIVLAVLLRSVTAPVKLFVSMLMGIVWTLAAFTLVFQYWLQDSIIWILPIILFCTLMGLGGDYVVFMMSRVREEVARGRTDEEAIEHAVEVTGPVILLCGLVMASAFGSMMISSMSELTEFGFALSLAIMLDCTLMVLVLIPSIMMLLRKYNWWMPFVRQPDELVAMEKRN